MILVILDCCGVLTMVSYTAKIFAESGSDFPPNQAAIIVGIIQLIGTYLSTMTVDHVGRKVCSHINVVHIFHFRSILFGCRYFLASLAWVLDLATLL